MSINKMERKAVCEVCSCKSDCLNEVEELNICNGIPLSEALSILCKELILFICTTCCQLIEGEYIQKCLNIKIKDEALESSCFEEDAKVEVKLEEIYNGILKSENLENTSSQGTLEGFTDHTNRNNENIGRMYKTHKRIPIECNTCKRNFSNRSNLGRHIRAVHDTATRLECDKCNKIFKNKDSLNLHKKTHVTVLMKCIDCNKIFKNPLHFKSHIKRIHRTTESVKCNECNKIFKNTIYFKSHIKRIHLTTESVKCNECHKIFKNKYNLQHHKKRHVTALMKCNDCNQSFKNTVYFKAHMRKVHDSAATCNLCNKILNSKYYLQEHKKRVH